MRAKASSFVCAEGTMVDGAIVGQRGSSLGAALPRVEACEYSQECRTWRSWGVIGARTLDKHESDRQEC
jgi:hypothetical protein